MRKVAAGIGIMSFGLILSVSALLVAGMNVQETQGWNTAFGRFWQTAIDFGVLPLFIVGLAAALPGIALMLWGAFGKEERKNRR